MFTGTLRGKGFCFRCDFSENEDGFVQTKFLKSLHETEVSATIRDFVLFRY